jgi:hypothetical protein
VRRIFLLAAVVLCGSASPATASQLIDRNANGVGLAVNGKGEALLTYSAGGVTKHVLAWGAVNALAPSRARPQVAFKLDYAGGYGKYHKDYWKTFGTGCGAYDGPPLGWLVKACKAPDGSYWALQAWQRALPNYGVAPTSAQSAWELHLSHWQGELPVLTIKLDWSYHRFQHLYGSFVYQGSGVFGFRSTHGGMPLDSYGRNLYLDTFDSSYGAGWKRENSFLTHRSNGTFCYGFYPHAGHPAGNGSKYRATIIGPGVAPDILWQGDALGAYDRTADAAANEEQHSPAFADPSCKVN